MAVRYSLCNAPKSRKPDLMNQFFALSPGFRQALANPEPRTANSRTATRKLINIRLQPTPKLIAVAEKPDGHSQGEEDQEDARSAHGFSNFFAAAFVAPFSALVSHGCVSVCQCIRVPVYPCTSVSVYQCIRVPVYPCTSVSVCQCIRVPVYPCTSVSVYPCINVSLYPLGFANTRCAFPSNSVLLSLRAG